jgi:hypothetical protein
LQLHNEIAGIEIMSKLGSLSIRLPITALAGIAIVLVDYLYDLGIWPSNAESYVLGNCIAISACLIAFYRGGIYTPVFWFTLAAAYVLLSPLFSYSLGYEWYSVAARQYQTLSAMSIPTLEGALAAFMLAVSMSALPISAKSVVGENRFRSRFGPRTNCFWLLFACVGVLFFAWLAEPGPIVGMVDLAESRSNRFSGTRFAGGAWALFSVLSVYFYLGITSDRTGKIMRLTMRAVFYLSIGAGLVWLILHARRSETLGFMLYLYCVLNTPKKKATSKLEVRQLPMPEFINRRTVALGLIVLLFAAIGYYRTTLTWQFEKADFVQSPGGVANNFLGYVTAFDIAHHSGFGIYPGQTYLNQLQDIPPQFMGLPQAPDAYDILSKKVNLIGGEYWLMEPVMNFGGLGIALFAGVISWLATCAIRAMRRAFYKDGAIHSYLQGGIFITLMFRTLWYGPSAEINGAIEAVMAGGGLYFLWVLGRAAGFGRKVPIQRGNEILQH